MGGVRRLLAGVRVDVVAVGVAAAMVAAAWILIHPIVLESDFLAYYEAALSVSSGGPYVFDGHPSAYWAPGYPLLLALVFKVFGAGLVTVAAVNVALHAAGAMLAFVLASALTRSRLAAFACAAFVTLDPDILLTVSNAASENLALPLMTAAALAWIAWGKTKRGQAASALGALLGLAALTRPVVQYVPLLFAAMALWPGRARRPLLQVAILIAAFVIVLSPWVVRNALVIGEPVVTTNGGANLALVYREGATGRYDDARLEPRIAVESPADELLAADAYQRRALAYAVRHPAESLRSVVRGARMLLVPSAADRGLAGGGSSVAALVLTAAGYLRTALLVIVAWGLISPRARATYPDITLGLLALSWVVVHALAAPGTPRFLIPVLPVIAAVALGALPGILPAALSRRTDPAAP